MVENESWKNIEPNKDLEESIEKEIKKIDTVKGDSAKPKPTTDSQGAANTTTDSQGTESK